MLNRLSAVERVVVLAVLALVLVLGTMKVQSVQAKSAFRSDAIIALEALERLQSAVQVGTLYADYTRRVADTNADVAKFLRKWPTDRQPPLRFHIEAAMGDYSHAGDVWGQGVRGGYRTNDALQNAWRSASKRLADARAMVR